MNKYYYQDLNHLTATMRRVCLSIKASDTSNIQRAQKKVETPYRPSVNNYATCSTCKHFIANDTRCSLFGLFNVVTGEKTPVSAYIARSDENSCGLSGVHHVNDSHQSFLLDPVKVVDDADVTVICEGDHGCYTPDGFHWLNCDSPPRIKLSLNSNDEQDF